MEEEKKDYYILTDSKEKFEEIEKAYKKFRENYAINGGGRLIIRENPQVHKEVSIYPETKSDTIKEITKIKSDLEGRLISGNGDWYSGCWFIELRENRYFIYSKNPDFKKR